MVFFVCVISKGEECSRITYNNVTYSLYLPVYLHAFFTLQLTYFFQLISREGEIMYNEAMRISMQIHVNVSMIIN